VSCEKISGIYTVSLIITDMKKNIKTQTTRQQKGYIAQLLWFLKIKLAVYELSR